MSRRPNILFVIADDQSWPHAGAYGCGFVETPAFDRVAEEGIRFENAFCCAPSCSPARATALTGMNMWRLQEAAQLFSIFPAAFDVYPDLLERHGYHVGYTGKGWAPGNWEAGGRTRNPAGPEYNAHKLVPPPTGVSVHDYTRNFLDFLDQRGPDQPFCFWFGAREPHRPYVYRSGVGCGKRLEQAEVPPFLPDCEEVRHDLLDYAVEIEWYDRHLGRVLDHLEDIGELDDTLVVVTADNGMPFPRAKTDLYTASCRVPMALRWGARSAPGRVVTDFVSFCDLAPTFLEAAGVEVDLPFSGRSLLPLVESGDSGRIDAARDRVFLGRERHGSYCRPDMRGYPSRSLRTDHYHYRLNFAPDRWPCGDPPWFAEGDRGPSKRFMIDHREDEGVRELAELVFARRPAEELYDLGTDPHCLRNLADRPELRETREGLRRELEDFLRSEGDPRVLGYGDIFDAYPSYSTFKPHKNGDMPPLPGFHARGEYNERLLARAEAARLKIGIDQGRQM